MVLKYLHSNVIQKKVNDTENQEYDTFYETIWFKKVFFFFLKSECLETNRDIRVV